MFAAVGPVTVGRNIHQEKPNATFSSRRRHGVIVVPVVAMAQTNTPATQPNATPSTTAPHTADQNANATNAKSSLRMQVRDMMQKAGFSDIHMMTGSLLIRAKDKDGNPVVMNVSLTP